MPALFDYLIVAALLPVRAALSLFILPLFHLFRSLSLLVSHSHPGNGNGKGKGKLKKNEVPPVEKESDAVAVVGGGIAGCGAAWALGARGTPVTLLEARPVLGGNAKTHLWHIEAEAQTGRGPTGKAQDQKDTDPGLKNKTKLASSSSVRTGLSVLAWPRDYFHTYGELLRRLGIETTDVDLPFCVESDLPGARGIFSNAGADAMAEFGPRSYSERDLGRWTCLVSCLRSANALLSPPPTEEKSLYATSLVSPLNYVPLRALARLFLVSDEFWEAVVVPIYSSTFLTTELDGIPAGIAPVIDDFIPLAGRPRMGTWCGDSSEVFAKMVAADSIKVETNAPVVRVETRTHYGAHAAALYAYTSAFFPFSSPVDTKTPGLGAAFAHTVRATTETVSRALAMGVTPRAVASVVLCPVLAAAALFMALFHGTALGIAEYLGGDALLCPALPNGGGGEEFGFSVLKTRHSHFVWTAAAAAGGGGGLVCHGPFSSVVFACPAPRAAEALAGGSGVSLLLRNVRYAEHGDDSFVTGTIHSDASVLPAGFRDQLLDSHANYIHVSPATDSVRWITRVCHLAGAPLRLSLEALAAFLPLTAVAFIHALVRLGLLPLTLTASLLRTVLASAVFGGGVDRRSGPTHVENTFIVSSWFPAAKRAAASLGLPRAPPMLVTYNRRRDPPPGPGTVGGSVDNTLAHPTLTVGNILTALLGIPLCQGARGLFLAGNYTTMGNGHDLSLLSGVAAAGAAVGAEGALGGFAGPQQRDLGLIARLMGLGKKRA